MSHDTGPNVSGGGFSTPAESSRDKNVAPLLPPTENHPPKKELTPPEQLEEDWHVLTRLAHSLMAFLRRQLSMGIWREIFRLDFILGWSFISFVATAGLGMLGLQAIFGFESLTYAEVCFVVAALLLLSKVVKIAVTGDYPPLQRALFTFLCFGFIGVVLVEVIRAIEKHRPQVATAESRTAVAQPADIVIETSIHPGTKELSITNAGKVAISNLQMVVTVYFLNKGAWGARQLSIADYTTIGGAPYDLVPSIEPYWPPRKIDLTKIDPALITFDEWPKETVTRHEPMAGELKNYCFRVTFRDSRNGEKYATYAVTSGIRGPQHYSSGASDDPARPNDFGSNIPQLLIEHNRTLWKDGAKEYLPEPLATAIRANETRYSKLSNKELKQTANEFIDKMQAFAERVQRDDPTYRRMNDPERLKQIMSAKSDAERQEIILQRHMKESQEDMERWQAREAEYQRDYRATATLLHDEFLRRLPRQPTPQSARDFAVYDSLAGPWPLENIITELRQFVELLPD